MVSSSPPAFLLALAPLHLRNYRQHRYTGGDLCVSLEALAARDQTLLRKLYARLNEMLFAMVDKSTDDARKWQEIASWIGRHELDTFLGEVREIGKDSHEQCSSEALAKAIHDVRGGPLSALLGRLQLFDQLPQSERNLKILFVLTRDHLKIMRSAVIGLDEPRREADRSPKAHNMSLMVDKWHESILGPNWCEHPMRLFMDCRYEGALTECCLESAAIDRIFYNLATNACRHSVGERLDMAIFPIPDAAGECLRFVLSNEVNGQDAEYLRSLVVGGLDRPEAPGAHPLHTLFTPRVSSTGSGYGLTVVADFVANAFGLLDREQALREGYVGVDLDGHTFRAWFHWPAANDSLPPKTDDYHHPEQSLSEP